MTQKYDVGVVVGRFQVPDLHYAHKDLVDRVCAAHDKVIVFLGVSPLWSTRENPLDFEARKQMLLSAYPHVSVLYVKDVNDDAVWSRRLDQMVGDLVTPAQTVVLYGGRDSFIEHYSGRYPTQELEQEVWLNLSGTDVRKHVSASSVKGTPDFRAGVVWSAYSRFPTVYTTVDVAIVKGNELLLGQKEHERAWRFIGGFADVATDSFEHDAKREVLEETGLDVVDLTYLGSFNVDDWRYRREVDKIRTLFYSARYYHGSPRPHDDIAAVRWFDLDKIEEHHVMPAHRPLLQRLLETHRWTPRDTDKRES